MLSCEQVQRCKKFVKKNKKKTRSFSPIKLAGVMYFTKSGGGVGGRRALFQAKAEVC